MTQQNQWLNTMLDMTRSSFEIGTRAMDSLSEQTEKMVDLMMSNANLVQEETRNMVDNWLDNQKNIRQMYKKTVEEGLNTLEQQFAQKGQQPKKTK